MAATELHCFYCFETLVAHLENRAPQLPVLEGADDEEYPLFVTWNTVKPLQRPRLRGCIGNFGPMNLLKGLKEYALISALRDRRFSPISVKELPSLSCSVSLLVKFEEAKDYKDWRIGTHGLWISFKDPNNSAHKRTATYLPDVPLEQDWSKTETIDMLLHKGGFTGKIDEAMRKSIQVTRYQSAKYSVMYEDYQGWREKHHNTTPLAHSDKVMNGQQVDHMTTKAVHKQLQSDEETETDNQ